MPPDSGNGQRHVLVVGGGFAGVGCVRRLAKHRDVRVTLIDQNNYHQFQPLLYQVATSQLAPSDVAYSLRKLFQGDENVRVKLGQVAELDPEARSVTTSDGERLSGDDLVLAAGSQPNFFHTPGAGEHAFPLYSLDDAQRLRSRDSRRVRGGRPRPRPDRAGRAQLRRRRRRADRRGARGGAGRPDPRHDDRAVPRPAGHVGADPPRGPRPHAARSVLRQGARLRRQGAVAQGRADPPRRGRDRDRARSRDARGRDGHPDPLRRLGRRHHGDRRWPPNRGCSAGAAAASTCCRT